jgi:hypothetical protein
MQTFRRPALLGQNPGEAVSHLTFLWQGLHDITKSLGKEIFAFLRTRKSQRKEVGGAQGCPFLDT